MHNQVHRSRKSGHTMTMTTTCQKKRLNQGGQSGWTGQPVMSYAMVAPEIEPGYAHMEEYVRGLRWTKPHVMRIPAQSLLPRKSLVYGRSGEPLLPAPSPVVEDLSRGQEFVMMIILVLRARGKAMSRWIVTLLTVFLVHILVLS